MTDDTHNHPNNKDLVESRYFLIEVLNVYINDSNKVQYNEQIFVRFYEIYAIIEQTSQQRHP